MLEVRLFCSVLFCSILFCSVLFCSVLFCSVLFCSVLFCSVLIILDMEVGVFYQCIRALSALCVLRLRLPASRQ